MSEELCFSKIENDTIFVSDYRCFEKNNKITFSKEGIAVLYGPNGTGKTSLVRVLSGEKGTSVSYRYNDVDYQDASVFYIINDQNNRNIIHGTAKDFLLGDNIKKEYELQDYIKTEYVKLCTESISILKSKYGISSSTSKAIDCFAAENEMQEMIKDLMNNRSKGQKKGTDYYIGVMEGHKDTFINKYDVNCLEFLIRDFGEKSPLLDEIEALDIKNVTTNSHIKEVEENTEAIKILSHFNYMSQCIVCDTENIDVNDLLAQKTQNREKIVASLDKETKKIIERIIEKITDIDPFNIKQCMLEAIETGNLETISCLKEKITEYKEIFTQKAILDLVEVYSNSDIKEKYIEHQKMISEKPEIAEEDLLYIEQIISNSMNKNLQLVRDSNKNIKIVLDDKDFLDIERNDLPLSTGEQNFLSLTFEFLKAKNSDKPIIVLDDPISSFDSIYKNKIAYAIVKMLQNKKRIILTHNVDLLRLLDGQFNKCFKLFLFNNTENEENGFLPLKLKEQEMMINLEKLIDTFRCDIYPHIIDVNLFLVSMIPFMRGFAALNCKSVKEELTQVMHGYKTGRVNISNAYRTIFGNEQGKLEDDVNNVIPLEFTVNVDDILNMSVDGKEIINKDKYPLLNRTLKHSFSYLFLRLLIEKKLVDKYNIDTENNNQLGQIISEAFPDDGNKTNIKNRVLLTSKKTLLNEFNHFEGNLSIFQPAIDITDHMLGKEKTDILAFVSRL